MNYVYVLKNSSYEAYVVKIGKTTQNPTVRASQLYWGRQVYQNTLMLHSFVLCLIVISRNQKFIKYLVLIEEIIEENFSPTLGNC